MKRIFVVGLMTIIGAIFSTVGMAKEGLKTRLVLDHVNIIRTTEHGNDELYFDISVYHSNKTINHIRVPNPPLHWPSKLMEKASQLVLWSGSLQRGQSVTIMVSLMEADSSPLNPDDTIGSVRVTLTNQNDTLQAHWLDQKAQYGKIHKFDLQEEGHYQVFLSTEAGDENSKGKRS